MDLSAPIELDFKSAQSSGQDQPTSIRTFTSYNFDRNIMVPAAAFRFSAPGIDIATRLAVRSGDTVTLWAKNKNGTKLPVATGFVDETDTHITPSNVDYLLTGRDTLGQLIDNAAIDAQNKIIYLENATLNTIFASLIANTRMPQSFSPQGTPTGALLFQTNPGETKINALQRYFEFTNCLVWTNPDGTAVLGKPNFTQARQGSLILNATSTQLNNVLEARSRRDTNTAIRQIVTQLQTLGQVDAGRFTNFNQDQDMKALRPFKVGRSVFTLFSYGQGDEAYNQLTQVGNSSGDPNKIGSAMSLREIARDNMKILDVEVVVAGHINENGNLYNVDQVYNVQLEDDAVNEDLYVYSCSYELTIEHGMLTRMRLCRLGTITAYTDAIQRTS